MPKQKNLKRRIRARMEKTGEAYTTARRRLLEKREGPRPGVVPESEWPELAGTREETLQERTGRGWRDWVSALDAIGADRLEHREIAAHVASLGVSHWWSQTVAVGYERIRGLREAGQRADGDYVASKSKTFPAPVARLWEAFADPQLRRRWLPEADWEVRTAIPEKSMRVTWPDGTRAAFYFVAKGDVRSTVAIEHGRLGGREEVEERKAWWAERLAVLAEGLTPG